MKYIKQNIEGYNVKFKIIIGSVDFRDYEYVLQIKYKYKSKQIFSYFIYLERVSNLNEYKTLTDKRLIDKVTPYIIKDIKRRESYLREI